MDILSLSKVIKRTHISRLNLRFHSVFNKKSEFNHLKSQIGSIYEIRHRYSTETKAGNNKNKLTKKFKELWSKYGMVAVGTYLGIYVTTLGSIFVALDFDLFRASTFGIDPIESVKKVCDIFESLTGINSLPGYIRENPRVVTLAIAWIMTKFTEPIRFALTLGIVPSVSRFLGRKINENNTQNNVDDNLDNKKS